MIFALFALWSKSHAACIIQTQSTSLRLFLRNFQSRASPDPLNTLEIHQLAFAAQKTCDSWCSIATIHGRKFHNPINQCDQFMRLHHHEPPVSVEDLMGGAMRDLNQE